VGAETGFLFVDHHVPMDEAMGSPTRGGYAVERVPLCGGNGKLLVNIV